MLASAQRAAVVETARDASHSLEACWICGEDPIDKVDDGCWIKYTVGNRQVFASMVAATSIAFKEGTEDVLRLCRDGTYLSPIKPEYETYLFQDAEFITGNTNEVKIYPDDDKHGGDMRHSISGARPDCSSTLYTLVCKPSDS